MIIVIIFASWNILRVVATLSHLVEDGLERAATQVRPISREGASEKGPAVDWGPIQLVTRQNGAFEFVTDFFRAFAFAACDHVSMGTNSFLVIEDKSSGTSVDRSLSAGAMEILVALLQLEYAILTRTICRRLRCLKKSTSGTVNAVRKGASNTVEDETIVT